MLAVIGACMVVSPVQAQSSCPAEESSVTSFLAKVLESPHRAQFREDLYLSHLQGQQLRVLGAQPSDEAICDALYMRYSEEERTSFQQAGQRTRFVYYQIGDRYIEYSPSDTLLGVDIIVVFDLDLNLLARGLSN